MNDKKNIDRLFQEKFKDFEMAPDDAVWNRISESLPKKKKKRRVIALWWQYGGVAAVIAILLTIGVSVYNSGSNNNPIPSVVETDNSNQKEENKKTETNIKDSSKSIQNELKESKSDYNNGLANSSSDENLNLNTKENTPSQQENSANTLSNTSQRNRITENKNINNKKEVGVTEKQQGIATISDQIKDGSKVTSNSDKSKTNSSETNQLSTENELKSAIKNTIKDSNSAVVSNDSSKNTENNSNSNSDNVETTITENSIVDETKKQSIEDAIAENSEDIIDEKEEENQNRWSIAPNVAPVYYSSLGKGSSIDSQFNENAKSSDVNMSYGINASYAVSRKLKIRAGVNRVNLSQKTSDVFAFAGSSTAARATNSEQPTGNINYGNKTGNIVLMSSSMLFNSSAPEVFNTHSTGNVDQRFGFIEVPLELEYSLLDKKFGVNVIGGFSTFFLSQNEIYADIDGASTLIGEANNINNTSFSANFGLGLDYNLSQHWNINLEPQFKYQINTFSNTYGDYRPFFIGVYTGLSFKF